MPVHVATLKVALPDNDVGMENPFFISGKVRTVPLMIGIANGLLLPFPFFAPNVVVVVGFQVVFRKDMEKRGLAVFVQRNHRWYAGPAPSRVPNLTIFP